MSRCAVREAAATGEPVDVVTGRLNSLFWTAFQFNGAVGLIISSVLSGVRGGGWAMLWLAMFHCRLRGSG